MKLFETIIKDYQSFVKKNRVNGLQIVFSFLYTSGFRAVVLHRIAHYCNMHKLRIIGIFFEKLMHVTTITWIGSDAIIGNGFVIRHVGSIVVGNKTVIGKNCEIRQGVTFGGNMGKLKDGKTQPTLGDNVLVGAGAKILGPIRIGNNCIIGANSVVIRDIPENSVVGGVPGVVIRQIKEGENPLLHTLRD